MLWRERSVFPTVHPAAAIRANSPGTGDLGQEAIGRGLTGMGFVIFEENKPFVLEALGTGEFDYMEAASEVFEAD